MTFAGKPLVYLATLALVFATACGSEIVVTKVDPSNRGAQSADGVLFSLPETVVLTEVPLAKVAYTPGVFYRWTEFFYPELTADDYVVESKTVFKVGAPTFSTRGQTDPNNVYIAHIKAKAFETKTLLLEFNEDGIIARTETSSKDETIDVITSVVKTAASFVAPLMSGGIFAVDGVGNSKVVPARCEARVAAAKVAAEKAAEARAAANVAAAIAADLAARGPAIAAQTRRATRAAARADAVAHATEVVANAEKALLEAEKNLKAAKNEPSPTPSPP